MMPSLDMCGFLYCGADTGGFGGDVDPELLVMKNEAPEVNPELLLYNCPKMPLSFNLTPSPR